MKYTSERDRKRDVCVCMCVCKREKEEGRDEDLERRGFIIITVSYTVEETLYIII